MTSQREIIPATPPLVEEALIAAPRSKTVSGAGAKCTQCGNIIRHMPIFLRNITCRDCYGLERYKRGETSMIGPERKVPAPATESGLDSIPPAT
ncbi:hypothetical protein B1R32_11082 [Abditibacterium utsteinense]|uniref:Uncharacterized protein n=1 Tax=Abditibacterium utsteinense TaxID=1960156 RepID=A0A2S8SS63_9BACT|nr:hypothetical protein [Abditibacterium utsteinense]PQV63616.1 hypothetical protein B1R32_11082 [Abditibacterium utsteinense]